MGCNGGIDRKSAHDKGFSLGRPGPTFSAMNIRRNPDSQALYFGEDIPHSGVPVNPFRIIHVKGLYQR
jgi:hypothetical protein